MLALKGMPEMMKNYVAAYKSLLIALYYVTT